MNEYRIRITETLSRLETIEADCEDEALDYAENEYADTNIVLDFSDFDSVKFEVD